MPIKKPIKTGTRFSNLVVIKELVERRNGHVQYLCQCNCGNTTTALCGDLRAGKHKSCGCLRHLPHQALPPGVAGFNSLFAAYKNQAKVRKYEFNLTKHEFKALTSSDCFYCGTQPLQQKRSRADSKSRPYFYNGIDRINNDEGYALKNCIPCCGICNRMKRNLSQKEFLEHINKMVDFIQTENF